MLWCCVAGALAGVWVRGEGDAYAQVSYGFTSATATFDEAGTPLPMSSPHYLGDIAPLFTSGRFVGHEVTLYGEFGVGRNVEMFGSLPVRAPTVTWTWAVPDNDDVVQTNFGLGDAVIGVRYGQVTGAFAWSTYGSVRLPLYDNNPFVLRQEPGNSDFIDDRVSLGQGTVELDVGASAGASLGGRGWVLGEAGLRLRDRGYAVQLPARAQVGWTPVPEFGPLVDVEGLWTIGQGTQPTTWRDAYDKGPLVVDGVSRVTLTGGLLARPWTATAPKGDIRRGLGVIAKASAVVDGARTAQAVAGSVAISWEGRWMSESSRPQSRR